mmetsp:Transcript_6345/g.14625  ORF Transcript_6345/g.14625 Transcript_6345/m.14625 type:complete len:237 (+) Transcript_6345:382-1092(+)|eukprot:CAMPEP_0172607554 /NCGR_PEP_ID=MMETSP1068-20121228/27698_1 /TAXON_ID=35684 /ORGANISM="Pseudopedinella elastica, Strain CCMP716" /LENGTH=236 /DNA_ID=CAMNT_0013410583 /DNA_START=376 /DNA_END=1086 /DNA_ORIENTATION=+
MTGDDHTGTTWNTQIEIDSRESGPTNIEEVSKTIAAMEDIKGELASQMMSIAQEVELVQKELARLKVDSLGEISQQMMGLERELAGAQPSEFHAESYFGCEPIDDECTDGRGERHTPQLITVPTTPSLRRRSAYNASGKVDASSLQRRISWSPTVKDNAKAPGEDSLSDTIKKRSMRHRAARNGGSEGSLIQTVLYCLLVFVLSNMIPKLLENMQEPGKRDSLGSEDLNFFGDGDF